MLVLPLMSLHVQILYAERPWNYKPCWNLVLFGQWKVLESVEMFVRTPCTDLVIGVRLIKKTEC